MGNEIQKWADKAMFTAEPIDEQAGPEVKLLSCNNDPLGTIAAAALMYEGKSVGSLAEITDDQRRYYLDQTAKSALEAPLEFVNFHFIISGVTRGFTHQMVRQRTATYTQESTRFAVKEQVPVGLPPSLAGTIPWKQWWDKCFKELYPNGYGGIDIHRKQCETDAYAEQQATKEQIWRREWDWTTKKIGEQYNSLVNSGMPAEDARGLLPTNLLTRINYNTSLRGLKDHAGVRLCTQAQYEWRLVWAKIKEAIVEYGYDQTYQCPSEPLDTADFDGTRSSAWQFEELSKIFKPICYYKGSCQFLSDVDRHCSIRDRVQEFAKIGVPSSQWSDNIHFTKRTDGGPDYWIEPIRDEEWMLDPNSARISQ